MSTIRLSKAATARHDRAARAERDSAARLAQRSFTAFMREHNARQGAK